MKFKMKPLSIAVGSVVALAAAQAQAATLKQIDVVDKNDKQYVAKTNSNPKFTQELVDTPKTINIVNEQAMEDQGVVSLEDALRNISGVSTSTMGSGEGGGGKDSLVNSITIRGFDSNSSIYSDGIRDLAGYKRDIYNVEQLEVAKGANGATQGKGSAGGSVNLVTKKANLLGDAASVTVSIDEGDMVRISGGDVNKVLSKDEASRFNFLLQEGGDYWDNGTEEYKTKAFSLSNFKKLSKDTDLTVNVDYMEQDNTPVTGIPFVRTPIQGKVDVDGYGADSSFTKTPNRADMKKYFGTTADFEEIESFKLTAILNHQINDNWALRSQTRFGVVESESLVSGPRADSKYKKGTIHADNRLKDSAGNDVKDSRGRYQYKKSGVDVSKDTWIKNYGSSNRDPGASRDTYLRDNAGQYLRKYTDEFGNRFKAKSDRNQIITTQFDLLGTEIYTGAVKHDIVVGAEAYQEEKKQSRLSSPSVTGKWTSNGGILPTTGGLVKSDYATKTGTGLAVYAIDTVTFNDQWQANAGVRFEDYEIKNEFASASTATRKYQYDLLSYNASVNYKPLPNGSIYVSYGNNEEPNGTDLSTTRTSRSSGYDALGKLDPLESVSKEIGTKWKFNEGKLVVAAAVFETTKDRYDTPSETEAATSGEQETTGHELSLIGKLTDEVATFITYTKQDAKITKDGPDNHGDHFHDSETGGLSSSPDETASVWVTHSKDKLTLGAGAQHNSGNKYWSGGKVSFDAGSVTVYNAMAAYQVSKNLTAQVNVQNLTDKFYVADYAGNNYKAGKPRNVKLSVKYKF